MTDGDGAELMSDGSSFHRLAPPTENTRLPTVAIALTLDASLLPSVSVTDPRN